MRQTDLSNTVASSNQGLVYTLSTFDHDGTLLLQLLHSTASFVTAERSAMNDARC